MPKTSVNLQELFNPQLQLSPADLVRVQQTLQEGLLQRYLQLELGSCIEARLSIRPDYSEDKTKPLEGFLIKDAYATGVYDTIKKLLNFEVDPPDTDSNTEG